MMAQVKPPRAGYVEHPLGRQCGKPNNPEDQKNILRQALTLLVEAREPGRIKDLDCDWGRPFGWPDYLAGIEEMLKQEAESIQSVPMRKK